jgi:hypothetical protein
MALTERQVSELARAPEPDELRTVHRDGRTFTALSGWRMIDDANSIFGVDGWDRETVEMRLLAEGRTPDGHDAAWLARVRVSVRAQGVIVVREGHGTGEATAARAADAHDRAIKAAETDATKRALATLGRRFGLGLYLGERPGRTRPGQSGPMRSVSGISPPKLPRPTYPPTPGGAVVSGGATNVSGTPKMVATSPASAAR